MLSTMKARLRRTPRTREVDRAKVDALLEQRGQVQARAAEVAGELAGVEAELIGLLDGSEDATAGGELLYTYRRDGTFASRQFQDAHPLEFFEFSRPTRKLDYERLARRRPDLYQKYRARVLRVRGR